MDHDRFAQEVARHHFAQEEVARLAATAGADEHAQVPCRGLLGGCAWCIALYRAVTGDERPTCLVCDGQHFAYEPHWAPDITEAVQLGVTLASAMPARWGSDRPVLMRLSVLSEIPRCPVVAGPCPGNDRGVICWKPCEGGQ